jgi:hypothetical protein
MNKEINFWFLGFGIGGQPQHPKRCFHARAPRVEDEDLQVPGLSSAPIPVALSPALASTVLIEIVLASSHQFYETSVCAQSSKRPDLITSASNP